MAEPKVRMNMHISLEAASLLDKIVEQAKNKGSKLTKIEVVELGIKRIAQEMGIKEGY